MRDLDRKLRKKNRERGKSEDPKLYQHPVDERIPFNHK
jgi:hypothetical protein